MRVEHPGGRNQMGRRNDPQGVYCVPLPLCLHEYRKKRSSTVGLSNNDVRSEPSITEARNNFVMSSNLKNYVSKFHFFIMVQIYKQMVLHKRLKKE